MVRTIGTEGTVDTELGTEGTLGSKRSVKLLIGTFGTFVGLFSEEKAFLGLKGKITVIWWKTSLFGLFWVEHHLWVAVRKKNKKTPNKTKEIV